MIIRKYRWSKVYESSEEELVAVLQSHKIEGSRRHIDAGDEPTKQHTRGPTTIWCAEGSVTIETKSNNTSLQPGDALLIDANTTYSVRPGITGCAYYLSG
jgi:mannose-6-phosphate isomerase class I